MQKRQKKLSYRKIRCFVRVTSFKKPSDAVKKYIVFFIKFSLIFHENRYKIMKKTYEIIICTKIDKKDTFGTHFCAKSRFLMDFRNSLWVPGKLQKGRGSLIKTTPWRDLLPFCSFECITFAAGFILALFGHYFDTVLAHKKLPIPAVFVP